MENAEKIENTEEENVNPIQDLIKASLDKDYNHANKVFGEVMTIKMNDLLDQEKVRLADTVYNGVPPEDEEIEDEDLEDDEEDIEGDEEEGESEEDEETEEEPEEEPENNDDDESQLEPEKL